VPEFIDLILTEWANDEERAAFLAGLTAIRCTRGGDGIVPLRRSSSREEKTSADGNSMAREQIRPAWDSPSGD